MVIYIILLLITSLITGVSLSNPALMKGITDIYLISLMVLTILSIIGMIAYKFITIFTPYEILRRDNTIVCNINNRRKRELVDISNIDEYLDKYKTLNIIDGYVLKKKNKKKKVSAKNLLFNDTKMTLADLYKKDVNEYNKIADFLKDLSHLDMEQLFWSTERLVDIKEKEKSSKDIISELYTIRKEISNKTIRNDVEVLIESLNNNYSNVNSKVINHYLPILANICKKYSYLEENDINNEEFIELHNNLHAIFNSIIQVINSRSDNVVNISNIQSVESLLNSKNNS